MADEDCTCQGEASAGLAAMSVNPFTALEPHFGMLLGVEDLGVIQGYPRGKMRLHNAWLHGAGAVWGLDVRFEDRGASKVLLVSPGLALDAAGHELYLDRAVCLDLGQWFEKHQSDPGFTFTETRGGDGRRFSFAVVACFRACPGSPVPAISSPCDGTGVESAFSRVEEKAELQLRPIDTTPEELPYPRLRVLFRVAPDRPELAEAIARRTAVEAIADPAARPAAYLQAFRDLAALDEREREPQTKDGRRSLFPEDPWCVLLAHVVDVEVKKASDGSWKLVDPLPAPDVRVRRALLPTATIQELLCGPSAGAATGGGGGGTPPPPTTAGPTIDPTTVTIEAKKITFTASAALAASSVGVEAISITRFVEDDGWSDVDIKKVTVDTAATGVSVELKEKLEPGLVRLIARGTGPRPILGADLQPLAGAAGGVPAVEGRDFVFVKERS
jgi:hypothetical protein